MRFWRFWPALHCTRRPRSRNCACPLRPNASERPGVLTAPEAIAGEASDPEAIGRAASGLAATGHVAVPADDPSRRRRAAETANPPADPTAVRDRSSAIAGVADGAKVVEVRRTRMIALARVRPAAPTLANAAKRPRPVAKPEEICRA